MNQLIEQENIVHFTFPGLLPMGQRFAINLEKGTINLMTIQNDLPCLLAEDVLTSTELPILLAILDTYPTWCPYHMIYATFYYKQAGEKQLDRALKRLNEAHENGCYDLEMRPLRGATSRLRIKLRPFGMEIVSSPRLGYSLMRVEDMHYGTSSTKNRAR